MVPISFGLVTMAGAVALFLFIFIVALAIRWRRSQILIDMDAVLADEGLRGCIRDKRERAARRRYRLLTGATLREARHEVRKLIANPELLDEVKKKRPYIEPAQGEGVRSLITSGRIDEAVEVYQKFMGVDKFTAEQAVSEMQREMRLSDIPADADSADMQVSHNRQQEKSRWE